MAKRRTRKSPKAAALVAALQRELRKAIWSTVARAKRDLAGQTIYGVALAIHGSGTVSGMAFGTEEGLEATVDQYLEAGWKSRKGNSRATLRDMLRWNCDDGWRFDFDDFDAAQSISGQLVHGKVDGHEQELEDLGAIR